LDWRLTWENLAQREERTVELTVRQKPEEALRAIRGYLLDEGGPYWEEVATDRVLEVRGPLVERLGCLGWVLTLMVAFATLGVFLLVLGALLLLPKPRVMVEAFPLDEPSLTRLRVSGRPLRAVALTEQWIRSNLPVRDRGR
jgi:hypothetical protein